MYIAGEDVKAESNNFFFFVIEKGWKFGFSNGKNTHQIGAPCPMYVPFYRDFGYI